ncbi:hypothetical protein WBG78_26730 [Chryseolinea sp. T2]|uniref:hypothetical protein n=1 Tax=Chryseolinea sp. T2 TaxID=3129255 RepID=UPI003077492C
MRAPHLAIATAVFLTIACSSGKKAYERGDYYEAVTQSVNRLRQNPDHSKSLEALKNAYPLAVEYYEQEAKNQIASNAPLKWKSAIESYNTINGLYELIRQCPGCKKVVPNPKEYYAEIGPLKEKAAEESYNLGIDALMKGNRMEARRAYFNFNDAQKFVPGYKDVVEYLDKAKFEATLKVVLEQIPVPRRYDLSGDFFQDKVESYLRNTYTETTFIRFYTPGEAKGENLQVIDQVVRIEFDDFSVGNSVLREKTETYSKDSVRVGEAKVNGKVVPVYNTVKAKLTTYHKEVMSQGTLSMVVTDAKTNGVLDHKKYSGQYVWVSEWARFNGDERALAEPQLRLCRLREQQPPGPQDLFLEFTKPIYNQLTSGIRGFYQNY